MTEAIVPKVGDILIRRSYEEVLELFGASSHTTGTPGEEYQVTDYHADNDDLFLSGIYGTFSAYPDHQGHSYATFFTIKE